MWGYGRGDVDASVGEPLILDLTRVRYSCLSLPPVNDTAPDDRRVDIQRVQGPELATSLCQSIVGTWNGVQLTSLRRSSISTRPIPSGQADSS